MQSVRKFEFAAKTGLLRFARNDAGQSFRRLVQYAGCGRNTAASPVRIAQPARLIGPRQMDRRFASFWSSEPKRAMRAQ